MDVHFGLRLGKKEDMSEFRSTVLFLVASKIFSKCKGLVSLAILIFMPPLECWTDGFLIIYSDDSCEQRH